MGSFDCHFDRRLWESALPKNRRYRPPTLNPSAIPHMWKWYLANLEALEQLHPIHYERVVAGIVPVCGIGKEEEVQTFFTDYIRKKGTAGDTIRMSLEKLRIYSRMRT